MDHKMLMSLKTAFRNVVNMIGMGTHAVSGKKKIMLQTHFCTERRGLIYNIAPVLSKS